MDFFKQSWHWLIFHVGTASTGRSVMNSWDNSQIPLFITKSIRYGP